MLHLIDYEINRFLFCREHVHVWQIICYILAELSTELVPVKYLGGNVLIHLRQM